MVSGQSFGSSAVSLACISSMCSVQCFSWRPLSSFSLWIILFTVRFLLFFAVRSNRFFFFVVFGYTWFFVQQLFLCNLGRPFWWDVCLGVWPWLFAWLFRLRFRGLKVRQQLFCGFLPRRIDCGFAFTGLAVKRLTNLAIKWSNELSGLAVHELSGSGSSQAQQLSGPQAQQRSSVP